MADLDFEGSGRFSGGRLPPMGRKDVDLNDPSLFVRKRELPAWLPLAVLVLALAVGAAGTGWLMQSRSALAAQVRATDARLAGLRPAAEKKPGDAAQDQALQAEVARMRARLDQFDAAPGALAVSTVLEALARATIDGVWLTRIQFDRTGRQLWLEGLTRDARLLPRYLQSLSKQQAFSGLPLAAVDATRADAVPGMPTPPVSFKIVSTTGGAADPTLQRAGESAPAAGTPPAPAGAVPASPESPARPARAGLPGGRS
jgi:Tfp pilus assembly protein PilN